ELIRFFLLPINRTSAAIIILFFQAEDGIRDYKVTGVQTCALPILIRIAGLRFRLADTMSRTWITFAKTGNPNHEGLPHWPKYSRSEERRVGKEWRSRRGRSRYNKKRR